MSPSLLQELTFYLKRKPEMTQCGTVDRTELGFGLESRASGNHERLRMGVILEIKVV
jgi:hypothetical protein